MGNTIREIKISEIETYRICQLIDLAGFKTIIGRSSVRLEDKNAIDADRYSDLTFNTLHEALRAVEPYIDNKFYLVS